MRKSKPQIFWNITKNHGVKTAISETLRYTYHFTSTKNYKPRLRITREWIDILSDHESISGAEIGVGRGNHAAFLLQTLDICQFYLIDPYVAYDQEDRSKGISSEMMVDAKSVAEDTLVNFESVTFINKYSDDAVSSLPRELDFVYIDGNHDYEYVKSDLDNYYTVVKSGGILAGHDYNSDWPGVILAVNEFANQRDLEVREDLWSDWFFQKPVIE